MANSPAEAKAAAINRLSAKLREAKELLKDLKTPGVQGRFFISGSGRGFDLDKEMKETF